MKRQVLETLQECDEKLLGKDRVWDMLSTTNCPATITMRRAGHFRCRVRMIDYTDDALMKGEMVLLPKWYIKLTRDVLKQHGRFVDTTTIIDHVEKAMRWHS